jgi:arginyl-tRNA synthetase
LLQELAVEIARISGLDSSIVESLLGVPKMRTHGDVAFPCFELAKLWKISPPECAAKLAKTLVLPAGFKESITIGPYLNFRYDRAKLADVTIRPLLEPNGPIAPKPRNGRKIIIEYSSPNIAKPFHVGHLRTTLIGHSLTHIYKQLGFEVISINHLGDWGTQFGIVFAGCELWGKPTSPTVEGLVELYRKASMLRKLQEDEMVPSEDLDKPDVNQIAREYFLRLEAGIPDALEFWEWCLNISLDYFKRMYDRLGITFDYYTGESFYRSMVRKVETELKDSGCLEMSEGALGVNLGGELGFARIFTADGRSLYVTRDIAAAVYRDRTFSPEQILYVVAAQQSLHFKQLIGILSCAGYPVAQKIRHVSFGFVPGMSTREGGAISLDIYLQEAHNRALELYRKEVTKGVKGIDEEDIAEKVAIGATYFYFLCHSNIKDFHFSWDVALNFHGDSGPYLQYAVARINSIEAKVGRWTPEKFDSALIIEDVALELLLSLSRTEAVIAKACFENEPYHIANHMLDVAKNFSRAYVELKIVDAQPEVANARLALFLAVRNVLQTGLKLLGVPIVGRM